MKIETRELSTLKEYDANARHNAETVDALEALIDRFGYLVPMVVTEDGEIVAGHARYQALKRENVTHASCVVFDGTKQFVDEYRLIDNKVHELSLWDQDKLSVELRGLETARDMFPDLKADDYGNDQIKDVTKEDIENTEDKLEGKYTGLADAANAQLVKVRCSGCEKEFKIKQWEIEEV